MVFPLAKREYEEIVILGLHCVHAARDPTGADDREREASAR